MSAPRFFKLGTLLCFLLPSCQPEDRSVLGGKTMGTTWSLQIARPLTAGERGKLQQRLASELDSIERVFSTWNPDSAISRFNESKSTETIPVTLPLAQVLASALDLSRQTEGAFDPTMGPLIDLWGFGHEGKRTEPPTPDEISSALSKCGADKLTVTLNPPTLRKAIPDLEVNPSAIVEGYAADQLGHLLKSSGYEGWLLEIGGEILADGLSPDGRPWRVGIQTPGAALNDSFSDLPLSDQALATSGTYRQRFEHGGRIYSHLINPKTGWPIETKLVSVSVLSPSCMKADAFATALMVLGSQQGEPLAQRQGLRVFWIEEN
jgi:thiamine biosynthesis lipoprotein